MDKSLEFCLLLFSLCYLFLFFAVCAWIFFFAVLQNLVQDSCLVSAVSSCFGSLTCPEDSGRGKSLGSPSAASA